MSVSIAIPFYNPGRFFKAMLRSVFAQTYQDWELILVDDGSTDGSIEIAQAIKDSRVRVYSDGKNLKRSIRRNQILSYAKRDYIAVMDADDLMAPERLQTEFDFLVAHPTLDVVTSGLASISDDDHLIGIRYPEPFISKGKEALNHPYSLMHGTAMAKKDWFLRTQYNPALPYAIDYDLFHRAILHDDLACGAISDILYYYHEEDSVRNTSKCNLYIAMYMILSYGRLKTSLGNFGVGIMLGHEIIKQLLRKLMLVCGVSSFLQKRRNPFVLSEEIVINYHKNMDIIRNTRIPGVD